MKAVIRGSIITASSYLKKERTKVAVELLNKKNMEKEHKRRGGIYIYKQLLRERKALEVLEISQTQKNLIYLNQRHRQKSTKNLKPLA